MIWNDCLKLPRFNTMRIIKQDNTNFDYVAVSYLNKLEKHLFPNILYFASYNQWIEFKSFDGLSFVLLDEVTEKFDDINLNNNTNILLFSDIQDFTEFYSQLQSELWIEREMNIEMHKLVSMVCDNVGLQKIVDSVAEIYQRPVTILDNAYFYIACSQNYIFPPSTMSESVKAGHLLEVAQHYLRNINIPNSSRKIKDTIVIKPNAKISDIYFTNYFTHIYLNNINICSFSIFEFSNNEIPENKLRYLPKIASILSAELQKKSSYMLNKANYYTYLFSTLLGDKTDDKHDIYDRLEQFGYVLERYKYIICVDLKNMYITGTEIQLLADRLHYCFVNSFYMITQDSVLYFMSCKNLISQNEVIDWNKIFEIESSNIKIGISSAFENLNLAKQQYEDAMEAIYWGMRYDPNKKIYLYDNYRIDSMVKFMSTYADLSSFCYPSLLRLIAYDEANGTNLSYTLLKFLDNPKNPAQVCEDLFIHKNTLYYRLNKIYSIMGSKLESANEITQINMTFTILKNQGRFKTQINQENGRNVL